MKKQYVLGAMAGLALSLSPQESYSREIPFETIYSHSVPQKTTWQKARELATDRGLWFAICIAGFANVYAHYRSEQYAQKQEKCRMPFE